MTITNNWLVWVRESTIQAVDRALKRFKKKFERTGVLKELRRRTFFQKPSITQRKQKQKAVYKLATYGQPNE